MNTLGTSWLVSPGAWFELLGLMAGSGALVTLLVRRRSYASRRSLYRARVATFAGLVVALSIGLLETTGFVRPSTFHLILVSTASLIFWVCWFWMVRATKKAEGTVNRSDSHSLQP